MEAIGPPAVRPSRRRSVLVSWRGCPRRPIEPARVAGASPYRPASPLRSPPPERAGHTTLKGFIRKMNRKPAGASFPARRTSPAIRMQWDDQAGRTSTPPRHRRRTRYHRAALHGETAAQRLLQAFPGVRGGARDHPQGDGTPPMASRVMQVTHFGHTCHPDATLDFSYQVGRLPKILAQTSRIQPPPSGSRTMAYPVREFRLVDTGLPSPFR